MQQTTFPQSMSTGHARLNLSWPVTLLLVVAGSIVLALSSKISVPFWPVPMTMQPLAVLLIGMLGGARIGLATVALYLAEGALGLPVFSGTPEKGIGLVYMAGPTGGYLVGFALSAVVTGALADRGWARSIPLALGVAMIGLACIYVAPFLVGDALKVVVAALAVPAVARLLTKR
jgi:biotin transport system substrate-specific component